MSDFLMPALGADMEAGTLVEWLIMPGDRVKRGDAVAVELLGGADIGLADVQHLGHVLVAALHAHAGQA